MIGLDDIILGCYLSIMNSRNLFPESLSSKSLAYVDKT
jgi:hypothetical protein